MSLDIPANKFTESVKNTLLAECVTKKVSNYSQEELICCWSTFPSLGEDEGVDKDDEELIKVNVPWRVGINLGIKPVSKPKKVKFDSNKQLYTIKTDPKKYRDQDVVFGEAMEALKDKGSVFLSLATGFGKTTLGGALSSKLGYKVCILIHLDVVQKQWMEEYKQFTTANVQLVKGKKLDPDADVYIMGIRKSISFTENQLKDIGTVIIDEAHICTTTCFSNSLLRFKPKYLIGLSATPKRPDGLWRLLEMYFGPAKEFIVREETKDFIVRKIKTDYQPTIRYNFVQGRRTLDWTRLITSLAENEERNQYIANLAAFHKEDYILILGDRVAQVQAIYDNLVALGESVDILVGGKKEIKKTRILVASIKKGGVGFDLPYLTMLILTSDVKVVTQLEGRIRCSNNIIYDIVDDFSTLEKHWSLREKWYIHRGATIEY